MWVRFLLGKLRSHMPRGIASPPEKDKVRQRSLAGYSPWYHKESDMTEQLTLSLFTNQGREEMKGPCKSSTGGVEAFPKLCPLSPSLILQGLAYAVQTVEVLICPISSSVLLVPYIQSHLSHVGLIDVLAFPPDY